MNWVLIVFIGSGLGIILIVLLKAVQIKYGVLLFFPRTRNKIESTLQQKAENIQEPFTIFSRKNIYIFLHRILSWSKTLIVRVEQKIDIRSRRLLSLIRGKQVIEPKNSSSDFLHDITRFKDRFKNQ
jgi:hypothetical protein